MGISGSRYQGTLLAKSRICACSRARARCSACSRSSSSSDRRTPPHASLTAFSRAAASKRAMSSSAERWRRLLLWGRTVARGSRNTRVRQPRNTVVLRWCSTSAEMRVGPPRRGAGGATARVRPRELASPSRRHTGMAADTTPGAGAPQPCPPLEKSEEAPHRTQLHESRRRQCHHMPGARASPCAAAPPTPDFSSRGPRAARSGPRRPNRCPDPPAPWPRVSHPAPAPPPRPRAGAAPHRFGRP